MSTHEQFKNDLIRALLKGARDRASEMIVDERSRLQDEIGLHQDEINKCQAQLAALEDYASDIDTAMEAAAVKVGQPIPNGVHVSVFDEARKDVRRAKVLQLAKMLTARGDGCVSVYNLLEVVRASGVELGVQSNREPTVLSNILLRSKEFEKIGKGEFRYYF